MKLVHKIILGNVLTIMFIALVYAVFHQNYNLVLGKLNFVEIADSLNATLLTMRLSEKNYFLYKDKSDILLIRSELYKSSKAMNDERANIIRAVGEYRFSQLQESLKKYDREIGKLERKDNDTPEMEESLREAGRTLRKLSERLVRAERDSVNAMISNSRKALFYFFCIILCIAITTSYFFFSKMFKSLRKIEKTANAISEGNFQKITSNLPNNELGSVMRAINSMCDELGTRHELLIESRKLASLGILTAGVAHELGNPLNNISMVAQTFIELFDHLGNEDKLDYMKTVLQESERIKKIVQDLLDFSKPKDSHFSSIDMNNLVTNSLKLVKNMLHISNIESKLNLEEDLPPVFVDEHKIEEVFVNLFINAIHAMSGGGTLNIRTRRSEDETFVVIEIRDTGGGIPPEFLENIFDPFFSTKGTHGTGLGLSISYGIIKKHNGTISVESRVGEGTTFMIQLPIHKKEE